MTKRGPSNILQSPQRNSPAPNPMTALIELAQHDDTDDVEITNPAGQRSGLAQQDESEGGRATRHVLRDTAPVHAQEVVLQAWCEGQ